MMLRGNGGADIFMSDSDRYHFYLLLQEGVERFEHRIHAFCLMTNHVHLVIQVGTIPLSRIMQNLSFRYTRWFNKHHKRIGHLFQGRFKALLIDEESYLLELVRYTHMNPVRAGMVKDPSAYAWSSHHAYTGKEVLPWLTSDVVLSRFSSMPDEARQRYDSFVADGMAEPHRPEFHAGASDARVLGDDRFAEKALADHLDVARNIGLDDCIAQVCRVYGVEPDALADRSRVRRHSEARAIVGWLIMQFGKESLTAVAAHFNRDVATMSAAIRKLEKRLQSDDKFKEKLDAIQKNIKL